MKAYFGSRISDNQTKTPEGYLICHNVPIARTDWYQYMGKELGLDTDDVVDVYRDPNEVFSPKAMASFEGKPVTNNHPPEFLTPENFSWFGKGVASNVRRGKGDDSDLLLADLIIYDAQMIQDIENGKREISAGYDWDASVNSDGTVSQKNIVGNHIALVGSGRAGERVRINDQRAHNPPSDDKWIDGRVCSNDADCDQYKNEDDTFKGGFEGAVKYFKCKGYSEEDAKKIAGKIAAEKGKDEYPDKMKARDSKMQWKPLRRIGNMLPDSVTDFFAAAGLKQYAQDAEPEEFMEAVGYISDERSTRLRAKDEDSTRSKESEDDDNDELEKLREENEKLKKQLEEKQKSDDEDDDAIEKKIEELQKDEDKQSEDEDSDEDESETIESDDEDGVVSPEDDRVDDGFKSNDSAIEFLKSMKPAIAAIKDPKEKKRVTDAAIRAVSGRTPKPSKAYASMAKARKKSHDSKRSKVTDWDAIKNDWDAKFNPHNPNFKKGK